MPKPLFIPPLEQWATLLREHSLSGIPLNLFPDAPALALLAAEEAIVNKSFRRGLVLLDAGEDATLAFLVWQGAVFGVYAARGELASCEATLLDVKEFRLGWLPGEAVRLAGGYGTAFAELPPEAEGFPLLYVTGGYRGLFAGQGIILNR